VLTTARPLFLDVPAAYADPSGLADQQAEGAVSLVVVTYPGDDTGGDAEAGGGASDPSPPPTATYDAFVAASGALLAVARSTPDYRFPVTPATALARFYDARDEASGDGVSGDGPTLSLYALDEADCARLLETAYYAECLKLHVNGAASADLVRAQLARSGCRSGLLEVNDFSDPAAPRVALLDLAEVLDPTSNDPPDDDLGGLLDGFSGRVLLYDRRKNRATLPDRAGHGFDLPAAIEQAARLAETRRASRREAHGTQEPAAPLPDPAETALAERSARAEAAPPVPPAASALGALVAELQGAHPAPSEGTGDSVSTGGPSTLSLAVLDETDPPGPVASPTDAASPAAPPPPPVERAPPAEAAPPSPIPSERSERHPPSPAAQPPKPHPLAAELDRLRSDVASLFEDHVGRDRARQHEAHVLGALGLPAPPPPDHAVPFLRALLTADPPRRWHLFKRARGRAAAAATDRLMAFHVAHSAEPDARAQAAVQDVAALWTRLHK
jgi:hypothetical protein